ncbi:MAG: GFA family protein, partial [Pseudomonadota bacterium]
MSVMPAYATGGCQCGAVRYRAAQPLGRANYCHCRMCQRATGNVFAVLVSADASFEGTPARFASSDVAERGFCAACGTPLFYAPIGSDVIELMVGSLNDPLLAEPALHYGVESMVSWLHMGDHLPRHATKSGGLSGNGPTNVTSQQAGVDGGESIAGGCQCGSVRFRAESLGRSSICHCRMCQRAVGNAFAPLVVAHGVEWDGTPATWASSNISERGFCADCGTPLFLRDFDAPDGEYEIMVAVLDDPEIAPPQHHVGIESRIGWLKLADDLP